MFALADAFVIRDGRLYMEYSLEYKKLFLESADVVKRAEEKWLQWYGSDRNGPFNNFAVRGRFSQSEAEREERTVEFKTV